MRIVIALDKLKGSLTALAACDAVRRGIVSVLPDADIEELPMADGGEGTAEILMRARAGSWEDLQVMGPLPHLQFDAGYARLRNAVVVEMASASGLELLRDDQRDPLWTTTYGTGQLLKAAAEHGLPVLLAVGGSATVDGGVGAAMACGWRFLDARDRSIAFGGAELEKIRTIVPPGMKFPVPVDVLCDVTNPLLGPTGAARMFGPQKGASPSAVERLERNLAHLADVVRRELGVDIATPAGSGAAGGLAGGAMAFFGGTLKRGADEVIEATGLRERLIGADWVITGEGSFDAQSLGGKVVSRVIELARGAGVKVGVLAGRIALDDDECRRAGIDAAHALVTPMMNSDLAMTHAAEFLYQRARELAITRLVANA